MSSNKTSSTRSTTRRSTVRLVMAQHLDMETVHDTLLSLYDFMTQSRNFVSEKSLYRDIGFYEDVMNPRNYPKEVSTKANLNEEDPRSTFGEIPNYDSQRCDGVETKTSKKGDDTCDNDGVGDVSLLEEALDQKGAPKSLSPSGEAALEQQGNVVAGTFLPPPLDDQKINSNLDSAASDRRGPQPDLNIEDTILTKLGLESPDVPAFHRQGEQLCH
ncbi:hypothetical protein NLI96_g12455 [Meripilus lineatus]|uniref:Uncharacterized protein n=1 Tax=Meripilus lineatus TaxID=2056292 RepID=A0AAD5YCD7_9APHY|nr:hypothetical protein NLI96_g12455 [Physisporinus lineatus]